MRLPARMVAGHLIFSHTGAVWACYRVGAATYPQLSAAEKLAWRARWTAGLLSLPAASQIVSVCRRLGPKEITRALSAGLDMDGLAAWQQEVAATTAAVADSPVFERRHYLLVRLPEAGLSGVGASLAAARASISVRFGLPPTPPTQGEIEARIGQARQLAAPLGQHLELEEVPAGETAWLYARAPRRGAGQPLLEDGWTDLGRTADWHLGPAGLYGLGEATFFEGGTKTDPGRPRHRRYLRIETEAGVAYQTFLVVADLPARFVFPGGGQWLADLGDATFPIDWAVRLSAVGNAQAQAAIRRQTRELLGQFDEYIGEEAGAPASLSEAITALEKEQAALQGDAALPELEASLIACVWAGDLDRLERRAQALVSRFRPAQYGLVRPTGGQLDLYQDMLPGAARSRTAGDYRQYLLPGDLAAAAPFATAAVGDPTGMLLGVATGGTGETPVFFDPSRGPASRDPKVAKSGSLAVAGQLGSGKSYMLKRLAWAVLARGGQVVAVDRTDQAEYVAFAAACPAPAHPEVVRLAADTAVGLDPLKVFAGQEQVTYTTGFLTLLARVPPTSLQGAAIHEAVQAVAEAGGDLPDVVDRLASAEDPEAVAAGRLLSIYQRSRLAGLVFEPGRPPADLAADLIVWHLPGLDLPSRQELLHQHLADQLLPDQLLSQALLYLLAALSRQQILADPTRYGALLIDEAWALLASPQGRDLLDETIRDGRKHHAGVWLASQHAQDLAEPQLVDLLGPRFVFAHQQAGQQAARLLGSSDVEGLARLLEPTSLAQGQCLMRDARGRIGQVSILPAAPDLEAAFDTTAGQPATTRGGGEAAA